MRSTISTPNCSVSATTAILTSYLDKLTLICQTGDFKTAIDMAACKRFHIYEGGEGKLTKQHAWMHTLYGKELAEAGRLEEAETIYMNGVNMPKSYGEAKTFFNQEAHIFYYLAKLYAKMGRPEQETEAYEQAANKEHIPFYYDSGNLCHH